MKIRSNALADLLRTTSCKVKNKVRILTRPERANGCKCKKKSGSATIT